ncbi:hypothetical protein OAK75_12140 [Bacteriovoracales bacterium]|nr:hypothetical protein [Bacteriovoracales bacterium]
MIFKKNTLRLLCLILLIPSAAFALGKKTPPLSNNYKVMTFNIGNKGIGKAPEQEWVGRFGAVIRAIKANKPDFIGTQEGNHAQLKSLDRGFHHKGDNNGFSFIELWKKSKMKLNDQYKWIGQGDASGAIIKRSGKYNAIYYKKNRFDVLEKGNLWYSVTGLQKNSTLARVEQKIAEVTLNLGTQKLPNWTKVEIDFSQFETRMFSWGKFRDKGTGKEMFIFNTQIYKDKTKETTNDMSVLAAKIFAVNLLRDYIFKKAHKNNQMTPVFVTGNYHTSYMNLPVSGVLSWPHGNYFLKNDYFYLNQVRVLGIPTGFLPDSSETLHQFGTIKGRFGSPQYPEDWTLSAGDNLHRKSSTIDKKKYKNIWGDLVWPSNHHPVTTVYTID